MKKHLLTLVFALGAFIAAEAQINQGAILIGANSNFGFNSVSPDGGDSYSMFNLNGKVGYFVAENIAAGIDLGFNKIDEESLLTLGAFGRYYINGAIIVGAGFGTYKYDDGDSDASATRLAFEGGYAAFITDNIAIEPTVNLGILSGDMDQTQFGLNIGFSLYLGRE